jgi:hypothetical protein
MSNVIPFPKKNKRLEEQERIAAFQRWFSEPQSLDNLFNEHENYQEQMELVASAMSSANLYGDK